MTHHSHRRSLALRRAVGTAPLIAAASLLLAACGSQPDTLSPSQLAHNEAPLIAYAKCMRTHGVNNFPNPSVSSAGGIGYPNSKARKINPDDTAYQDAKTACQNLPGASTAQQLLQPTTIRR